MVFIRTSLAGVGLLLAGSILTALILVIMTRSEENYRVMRTRREENKVPYLRPLTHEKKIVTRTPLKVMSTNLGSEREVLF